MYLNINYQPSRNDKWWRRNCLSWVGRLVVCLYICTRAYLIDHPFIACTSSVITTQTHTQKERPNYDKVWKYLIQKRMKNSLLKIMNWILNETQTHIIIPNLKFKKKKKLLITFPSTICWVSSIPALSWRKLLVSFPVT